MAIRIYLTPSLSRRLECNQVQLLEVLEPESLHHAYMDNLKHPYLIQDLLAFRSVVPIVVIIFVV